MGDLSFYAAFSSHRCSQFCEQITSALQSQGAPALPFDFPELSLLASDTSTSNDGDTDHRSFNNDPTAFSGTEVAELYPGIDAPLTVQRASASLPPEVAVLGSEAVGAPTRDLAQVPRSDAA